jgi:type VI secretion system protein ImpF
MPTFEANDPLLPSLLDRLIDDDPTSPHEEPRNQFQRLRQLKQSVRRDLENLLNTRWRAVGWPRELEPHDDNRQPMLDTSVANYGIPDFTGANLGSVGSREDFVRVIQEAIRRFEPRLRRVKVELVDSSEREDRTMRFRIDAMLLAEPEPEPVVFDSALEPTTGSFRIGDGGG